MAWLAAAIFGVSVIYFAIHYRGFRKGLLIALGVIAGFGALGDAYLYLDQQQAALKREAARRLINLCLWNSGHRHSSHTCDRLRIARC